MEVEYLSDCDWGTWACLPQSIRDQVRPLLEREELACWVGESVVLRRGESHSEERKAWWGSDRVLVLVDATRPLAELVRGGSSGACRWLAKRQGWMEQVVAYRLGEGRAVVLQARRGPAKREEALPGQPWRTRLVDAAVVEVTAHDLGGAAQDRGMLLPARMPRGQAPSRS